MTDQAAINFPITATDRTAKGRKSAEKSLGSIPKHVSAVNRRWAEADDRSAQKSSRGILKTFSAVEQASARAFGGRSMTAGLTSRLGALREAGAAAGTGLGEAASAGGVLSGVMGTLGVVAAGTVGVIASAAYGAFKLADGWAKGAASIGHLAALLGVSTKALQEFTAAGERVGVDKATGSAAIGGLSSTLNDANYGRNNEARAMLNYLGISMKTKQDGTADTEAMLPAIADAISRQNAAGRRTVAKAFGISDAALPIFSQGGGSLKREMADAGKNAPIVTDADVTVGQRMQRRHVMVAQKVERETMQRAGRYAAGGLDSAESWAAQQFSGSVTRDFAPGARKIDRAAERMERAGGQMERASGGRGTIGLTREAVAAAQATERKYGIPASITLGQYGLESSWGRRMPVGSNNPFGIKARAGQPYVTARTREEDRAGRSYYVNARFRKFDSLAEAFDEHAKLLAYGRPYQRARAALPSVGGFADALTGTYATDRQYGQKLKSIINQKGLDNYDGGRQPAEIPVTVKVELVNAPRGTKVTTRAGRGSSPAVSHAMQ